ncbi:MAG: dUTP diphosphatase [Hyphomicrobiales bacterium]
MEQKVMVQVALKTLPHFDGLELPAYETANSAGVDLRAAVAEGASVTLAAGQRSLIPTGLAMEIPEGYEAQIRPRSGLAIKNGVTALNSPGTIDADYRGEVQVILINHGAEPFIIERGMRIAQMVIAPVTQVSFTTTDELSDTERGAGGFGSTGVA